MLPALAALALAATASASAPASAPAKRAVASPTSKRVEPASSSSATADSTRGMTLKGGEEGTVFRTLTVQGEDRIHIEVERPTLQLDVDPAKAPGLDRGSVRDVLDRTTPDLEAPLLSSSAHETSAWVAHPWLAHFPEGAVARFRPAVTGVARWKLTVISARAESVAVFQGNGDPPREITWDGRTTDGRPVLPGTSYSYVFEARDKAGNKRNFVGEGFKVGTFRYVTPQGAMLVFAGQELRRAGPGGAAAMGPQGSALSGRDAGDVPPIVMELATAVNQEPTARPVRIEVTARSAEEASALGQRIVRWMTPYVLGGAARLRPVATVVPDAPFGGAVSVTTEAE